MPILARIVMAAALGVSPALAAADSYGARIDAALTEAAGAVDGDPARALAWVQGATDYEAYRGMLRGARGAFVTGRANSVDQALLLQAVLKPAASRLASCTLSETDAAALAATAAGPTRQVLIERAEALAGEATDAQVKDYLVKLAAAWTDLKAIQAEEGTALAAAVTGAGVTFSGRDGAQLKREAAAAHVWLQAENAGTWIDLDPTIDGAAPGATRCAATSTFDEVPAELRHRVAVDLVADLRTAAGIERRTLLHHEADAAELASDDVLLFFAEAQGAKTDADAEALKTGAFAYTPVLRIGAVDVTGTPFLATAPKSGFGEVGAKAASAVGGASDLIGGMAPPAEKPPEEAPNPALAEEPVAAFVELTLTSPGQPAARASVTLFDRIGAAARVSGEATALRDLIETDGDYAEMTTIWTIGVLTGPPSVREKADYGAIAQGDVLARAAGLAGALRGFEPMEGALLKTAGLEPLTTHLRPRLLLMGLGVTGQGDDARVAMVADLTASGIEDAPDATETAAQRAGRAVARVLAERVVAGVAGLPLAGTAAPLAAAIDGDMVALSHAAREQGMQIAKGEAAFEDADANALAAAHVAAGRAILLPPGSVEVNGKQASGWWVADADAGLLYDELGSGRSSESVEYVQTGQPARQSVPAWRRYGCAIKTTVMAASIAIGLATFVMDPSAGLGSNPFLNLAEEVHSAERAAEAAAEEAASGDGGGLGGCGPPVP